MHGTAHRLGTILGVIFLAAACGTEEPVGPTETTQVAVVDNRFNPSTNLIDAGQTVTWTWGGSNPHNVTFDDAALTASATQTQGTFEQSFDVQGEFTYYCTVHGRAVMSGSVVVGNDGASGGYGRRGGS